MDVREQIEKAIDDLAGKNIAASDWNRCDADKLKKRMDALPAFAPVSPVEWPTSEGLWSRNGVLFWAQPIHCLKYLAVLQVGVAKDSELLGRGDTHQLKGHWLPVTLIIPPAAPSVEKPLRPRRGDKVMGTWPGARENDPPHYLAIYLGPSNTSPGDEAWLAWESANGHLVSVSVGKHWRVIPGHAMCGLPPDQLDGCEDYKGGGGGG